MSEDTNPDINTNRWGKELEAAKQEFNSWELEAKDIVKKYMDEREGYDSALVMSGYEAKRSAAFWSTIQTWQPSLYAKKPKPICKRIFDSSSPIPRVASVIGQKLAEALVRQGDFDTVVKAARDDMLLPGRGEARVNYRTVMQETREKIYIQFLEQPPIPDEQGNPQQQPPIVANIQGEPINPQPMQEEIHQDEVGLYILGENYQDVAVEQVAFEFCHWSDFHHNSGARMWLPHKELRWVSFRNYLTRAEFAAHPILGTIDTEGLPFTSIGKPGENDNRKSEALANKVIIEEIWDLEKRMLHFVCPDLPEKVLASVEDPYKLVNFFPCPKPIYATLSTSSLVPVSDFHILRDRYRQLDFLTNRKNKLIKALRMRGFYPADVTDLQRLANEADETELIPVSDWQAIENKGGMQTLISWVPISEVANALSLCEQAYDQELQRLYEEGGISDLIRGQGDGTATATEQNIKRAFATQRMSERQRDVQRFCSELMQLGAELAFAKFGDETIKEMAGTEFFPKADLQYIDAAIQLLRDDKFRTFQLEIETDSILALDESEDKAARNETIQVISELMSKAAQAVQVMPEFAPVVAQLMLFGVRGYRQGRQVEGELETATSGLLDKLKQPPPEPQPDPKLAIEQQKLQIEQQRLQMDGQKMQFEAGIESQKVQILTSELQLKAQEIQASSMNDAQKGQIDMQLAQFKQQLEMLKAQNAIYLEQMRSASEQANLQAELAREELKVRASMAEKMMTQPSEAMAKAAQPPAITIINQQKPTKKLFSATRTATGLTGEVTEIEEAE